jgi:hypothetical protein
MNKSSSLLTAISPIFKSLKRLLTLALTAIAVNHRHRFPEVLEGLGQFAGAVFGARKHQHLVPVVILDELRKQFTFALAIY